MYRKRVFLFLFWILIASLLRAVLVSESQSLSQLYSYASKNIIYGGAMPEEMISELSTRLEKQTRLEKDYDAMFKIQLIVVNAGCLRGNIGLATTKAQQMYDDARLFGSPLGKALSIQAVGIAYMYSYKYKEALDAFFEAGVLLSKTDDDYSKMCLLVQQMHLSMLSGDMIRLKSYLTTARMLLDQSETLYKDDYNFYLICYQAYYNIGVKDARQARTSIDHIKARRQSNEMFDRWYYSLSSKYYELVGDYGNALLYCDSVANVVFSRGNINEYKHLLLDKALLLEKDGQKKESCQVYDRADVLSDSLDSVHYEQQIDSLRMTYWVDKMELENATEYNRMLMWVVCLLLIVLVLIIIVIYVIRRRNRQLVEARCQLEKMRVEIADSIQSKNLFLSNMSHELRTPLNAIVGFAGLIASDEIQDNETLLQCGELIKQNSDLLLKLFNDVADLSALKENNIRFVYGHCNVLTLCRTVVETVDKVKHTSAEIYFETSLPTLEFDTDSGRLQQVLINLLINATKFTPSGKIILKLEMDSKRNEAVFMVEDTGCGIPLEKQPHIFERFEKLHEGVQGAGLGLSICQLIVEYVGGKIWIDPDYTAGARFVFTHPLDNHSQVDTPKSK